MKKLLILLGLAAVAAANTGCNIDADLEGTGRQLVVNNIVVRPDEWVKVLSEDQARFDYFYCDKRIPEITAHVLANGAVQTYWKYDELREGSWVEVQEPLPAVMDLDRFENGGWVDYTETVSCSYDVGVMRLRLSRSDFFNAPPGDALTFRVVVFY